MLLIVVYYFGVTLTLIWTIKIRDTHWGIGMSHTVKVAVTLPSGLNT